MSKVDAALKHIIKDELELAWMSSGQTPEQASTCAERSLAAIEDSYKSHGKLVSSCNQVPGIPATTKASSEQSDAFLQREARDMYDMMDKKEQPASNWFG